MIAMFVGSSGSGKDSIAKHLGYKLLKSLTTRAPRAGEVDGVDYDFVSNEKFSELYAQDAFAECTEYVGNTKRYGVLKQTVMDTIEAGEDVYFVCDIVGYTQIKAQYPDDVVGFYIYTPQHICVERMRGRGDSEESIAQRTQAWEAEHMANMASDLWLVDGTVSIEENVIAIQHAIAEGRR